MKSIQNQHFFIYRRTGFIAGFFKLNPKCFRQKQDERTKNPRKSNRKCKAI